jgi:hypothetical protein
MDLTRYTFLNGNSFEIVLGKISDISNQYLILQYQVADKKSASGKTYSVINMSNTNQFFDSSVTGLFIKDSSAITSSSIFKDDLIGSVIRYELDKYLFSGIWLNTYAQLNIPSPIFYNVENVMNDLRMMYFGKQSETEILNSIRKNWYDGKYQNDLRIPLIDISKKFTDEFSIIDEPRDKDKFLDFISSSKKQQKVDSPSTLSNIFNIVRPDDDESNTNEFFSYFREGNLFLVEKELPLNFDIGNNFIKSFYYVLVYINENQDVSRNKLAFYPSLLVKKDSATYDGYLNVIQADYTNIDKKLYFKVGDFIRQDIQFSIKEKYEIGTIINSKSKYIIIGAFYENGDELKYLSISTSIFTSNTGSTNNATNKKIKKWTESEIDDLAKKKKVSIVSPTKSSYYPKEYLSGDVQISNPFQQQTMAKLSDELDSVRNKNEVLYNAFINVINAINKKIQDKIPQTKSTSKTDLYGISFKSNIVNETIFSGFNLEEALKNGPLGEGIGLDDFILSAYGEINSKTPYKYFTNTDDLIIYCGKLFQVFLELMVMRKVMGSVERQVFFRPVFYNLPLFSQVMSISVDTRSPLGVVKIGWMGVSIIEFSATEFLREMTNGNFSIEKRLNFHVNIIRQCLNHSYITRLRYESLVDFRPNDDLKKSLLMLNPYFTLDYDLLKAIRCSYVIYQVKLINSNQTISYDDTDVQWIDNLKYGNFSDIPEEIRMELFTGGGNIKIYDINGSDDKQRFINFLQKYDQTSVDVFNGAPLPKIQVESETDDFLSQIDEMDFSDNSLFADSIVDEVNNLDFDDPDLFN